MPLGSTNGNGNAPGAAIFGGPVIPSVTPAAPAIPDPAIAPQLPVQQGPVLPAEPTTPAYTPPVQLVPDPASLEVPTLRGELAKRNLDVSAFENDEAVVDAFGSALTDLQQLPELRKRAELGDRYQQHAPQFEAWMADQNAAPTVPDQQQPAPAPAWNPPAVEQQWYDLCEIDPATGRYKPKTPELAAYAHKLNEHEDYVSQGLRQFRDNPYEFIGNGLKPQFQEYVDPLSDRINAIEDQLSQQYTDEFVSTRTSGLLNVDQQGNEAGLTPKGEAFQAAFEASPDALVHAERLQYANDQAELFEYRQAAAQAAILQQQQNPVNQQPIQQPIQQPVPAQGISQMFPAQVPPQIPGLQQPSVLPASSVNTAQKDLFLQRAVNEAALHTPSRDTSVATAAESGFSNNPDANFGEIARQTAKEMGINLDLSEA